MILNALELTGRSLHLMPEYMSNKPVDPLIGEGLTAEDFNDDTLGRALDELQQAGVTNFFAAIAQEAAKVFEVESEYVHLDSSSLSLHRAYESREAQKAVSRYGAVKIKYGYSKDKSFRSYHGYDYGYGSLPIDLCPGQTGTAAAT